MATLEKENNYNDEHFDFIQKHIRNFCLRCILSLSVPIICLVIYFVGKGVRVKRYFQKTSDYLTRCLACSVF